MFKDIPWVLYYYCDESWNIYSKDRPNWRSKQWKILKVLDNWRGYKQVSISENGHVKKCLIHRLVAHAFLWLSNMEINHKDWNKWNNAVSNLEYVTRSENVKHSFELWLNKSNMKWKNSPNKVYLCFEYIHGEKIIYKSIKLASKIKNISYRSLINDIKKWSNKYWIFIRE